MSYRVVILPSAQEQTRELAEWWRRKRRDSRVTVKVALRKTARELEQFPDRYALYDGDIRRAPLKATPYFAFYRVREDPPVVEVVAVWSSQRGRGPNLE